MIEASGQIKIEHGWGTWDPCKYSPAQNPPHNPPKKCRLQQT